ncbi:unnamed protein product [Phytophthora lilii]|uniref:separase n=1 Tax=Phytophthora lilii TaxID=2077276 RepID=A0A9W6UD13_9STRA|nr:unnamed protein product [Phytophthora lilii]
MLVSTKRGPVKLAERNRSLLCAIADAQKWLLDDEVIDGLRHIAAEIEVPLSSSTARQVLEVLRNQAQHPEQNSSEMMHTSPTSHLQKLSTDKILNMKVSDIKQLLAAEGLRTDGLKKVLIERLITARETALLDASASSTCNGKFSTIMILNYQLQQFPWEGMDIMEGSAGVTRMPSLDLIIQNADRAVPPTSTFQVQRNSVRFLLNPGGDLKSTQNQLGPILESGARTYGWEGTVGEVPEPDTLR